MAVMNMVISRQNAPTMKSKKEQISKIRKGEKPKKHIWHLMTMKYHTQALLMMKKQISALEHLYPVARVHHLQSKVTTIINCLKLLMKLMKRLTD